MYVLHIPGFVFGAAGFSYRNRPSSIGLAVYDTCYNHAEVTISFTVNEQVGVSISTV